MFLRDVPLLNFPGTILITNHRIYFFFLISGVFTHEVMKNYRSLEAHNFFVSGWVQTVQHKNVRGNHVLFRADVKPSWRVTEEPHHPWVRLGMR